MNLPKEFFLNEKVFQLNTQVVAFVDWGRPLLSRLYFKLQIYEKYGLQLLAGFVLFPFSAVESSKENNILNEK